MSRSRLNPTRHEGLNTAAGSRRRRLLRRLPLASAISAILAGGMPAAHAATAADTVSASTAPEILSRAPDANSISIEPTV